jgi:hypothetical protein
MAGMGEKRTFPGKSGSLSGFDPMDPIAPLLFLQAAS